MIFSTKILSEHLKNQGLGHLPDKNFFWHRKDDIMAVSIRERYSKRLKIKTYTYDIELIDPASKERIRELGSGYPSIKEARAAGKRREMEISEDLEKGIKRTKIKFNQYAKNWIETVKPQYAYKTWKRYKEILEQDLIPDLGDKYIDKITDSDINKLYLKLLKDKSNNTVRQYHWILSKMFKYAKRKKMISSTAMEYVDPPKKEKKEMTVYNSEQLNLLLDRIKHMTAYAPVMLAATTGMREGEICGLRWKDIDMDNKTIYVVRQLQANEDKELELIDVKRSSIRNIPMIDITYNALKELMTTRDYNKSQCKHYDKRDFVVCKPDGSPYDPQYIGRNYRRIMKDYKICEKLEIPYIRFHDLRHTFATLLLVAGINPKVVAELMGHSNVSMTLSTYSHVLPGIKEGAVDKLNQIMSPQKSED